jgi:hypothetical protein
MQRSILQRNCALLNERSLIELRERFVRANERSSEGSFEFLRWFLAASSPDVKVFYPPV